MKKVAYGLFQIIVAILIIPLMFIDALCGGSGGKRR